MQNHVLQDKNSNKITDQKYLKKAHQQILVCLQEVFPPDSDFSNLQKFFQQDHNLTLPQISFGLVQYLVKAIKNNFIHLNVYRMLQQQTQRLQSSIRKHLKVQQQMKIYIQYLEAHNGKQSGIQQKGQKANNQLRQYIQYAKKEKQQLIKSIIKLKQQNSILVKEVEKRNKQVDRYCSILKSRKKTLQTTIGNNSFLEQINSRSRDEEHKISIEGHAKKIKYNFINGKTIDFNKNKVKEDNFRLKENYSNASKHMIYNGGKTQRYRPNSQSKLFENKHNLSNNMNTTLQHSQNNRQKDKISFSQQKDSRNFTVKIHKLQENSLENYPLKKKKISQTNQLSHPIQKCSTHENTSTQDIIYRQNKKLQGIDQQLAHNFVPYIHFLASNNEYSNSRELKHQAYRAHNK